MFSWSDFRWDSNSLWWEHILSNLLKPGYPAPQWKETSLVPAQAQKKGRPCNVPAIRLACFLPYQNQKQAHLRPFKSPFKKSWLTYVLMHYLFPQSRAKITRTHVGNWAKNSVCCTLSALLPTISNEFWKVFWVTLIGHLGPLMTCSEFRYIPIDNTFPVPTIHCVICVHTYYVVHVQGSLKVSQSLVFRDK
jgi:hypothetical protein